MRVVSPLRQRFPFVGLLAAAMLGILLASSLGATPLLVSAIAAIGLLFLSFQRVRAGGGWIWLLVLLVFALLQIWSWNDAPARRLAQWLESHPEDLLVGGVVTGEPRASASGSLSFPMRVEKITPDGAPILAPVTVQVRWEGRKGDRTVRYGDRVLFRGQAGSQPPPPNPGGMDYRTWLQRHGMYTQFRIDPAEPGSIVSEGNGNPLMAAAIAARHRMESILETDLGGAPDVLGAIKGITLGVTDSAPEGFTEDFRFTGTMHLFSVSGLHVGMLAVILWFVLKAFRIPRVWAVVAIIPLLFFYVAVTGMKAGSIRSASMASILLFGMVLFRRTPMINTLAASALLQLAIDTNTLFSAGWQFSYSVVLAILLLAAPLESRLVRFCRPDAFLPPRLFTPAERLRFAAWKHIAGLAAVSAAAWAGSLVPTAAYFHLISISALGANLLAVPLAFVVLSLGALALLGGTFSLWVAGAFNNANWLLTKLLLLVVQTSAMIPGGHWFVGPPGKSHPVMTVLDLGGGSCAVIRERGEFALVGAGRRKDANGTILPFLESSGANSLQSVLITISDAAHLGGVPMIARELSVSRIGIPPSQGRSPVAKAVLRDIREVPHRLSAGEEWSLTKGVGATILSPSAEESPDRLVVRIQLGDLRILLLPRLTPESARQLVRKVPVGQLRANVLLLPLGGSDIRSTLEVIRAIAPAAVISGVDGFNRNRVPSGEWEQLLAGEGVRLLRQDVTGAVTIDADPDDPKIIPYLHPSDAVSLRANQLPR